MVEGIHKLAILGNHYCWSAGKINGGRKVTRSQLPGSLRRSWFHGKNWGHGKYTAQAEIPTRKRWTKRNKYPGLFISLTLPSSAGLPRGHTEPEASWPVNPETTHRDQPAQAGEGPGMHLRTEIWKTFNNFCQSRWFSVWCYFQTFQNTCINISKDTLFLLS